MGRCAVPMIDCHYHHCDERCSQPQCRMKEEMPLGDTYKLGGMLIDSHDPLRPETLEEEFDVTRDGRRIVEASGDPTEPRRSSGTDREGADPEVD